MSLTTEIAAAVGALSPFAPASAADAVERSSAASTVAAAESSSMPVREPVHYGELAGICCCTSARAGIARGPELSRFIESSSALELSMIMSLHETWQLLQYEYDYRSSKMRVYSVHL